MSGSSPADLLTTRLRLQRFIGTPFRTAADAVRSLGAFQAQDYPGAKWSLGMRVGRATDASIDAALSAGKIIRTHLLRPTWHFVAPEDLRWILALGAPQVKRLLSYQHRELELDAKVVAKAARLIANGLAGGTHLTRDSVGEVLARGRLVCDGRRLAHLLLELEQEGLICSGRLQGKQQTYTLVDEWVAPGPSFTREESVVRLARRFFAGHAPATWTQFTWWSGLTRTETREVRDLLRKELEVERIGNVEWLGGPQRSTKVQQPIAFLIPEYDEILTGWAEIGIPRSIADRRKGKPTSTFDRPILIDGTWRGTWRRTMGAKQVALELERFGRWSVKEEGAVERERERYSRFIGMPVVIR